MEARLTWLEVILGAIDSQVGSIHIVKLMLESSLTVEQNPDIATYTPGMMDVLIQRLIEHYMKLMDETPDDNDVLGRIHTLIRQAKEMKAIAG